MEIVDPGDKVVVQIPNVDSYWNGKKATVLRRVNSEWYVVKVLDGIKEKELVLKIEEMIKEKKRRR